MKKRIAAMGMALALMVALAPTALAQQTSETAAEPAQEPFQAWFSQPENGEQVTVDAPVQSLSDRTTGSAPVDPEPDPDVPEDTYTG